jgi:NTP pyrophosphatase (non-canonical NTP hydrolase)
MELNDYQKEALQTDKVPLHDKEMERNDIEKGIIVPLLGLAGEAGELLSEYKKYLRDGSSHQLFTDRVSEELGDLLWYIADVAAKFGFDLDDIAVANLEKCRDRWGASESEIKIRELTEEKYAFDAKFPPHERLPRKFQVEIVEEKTGEVGKMKAYVDGQQVGDDLTDNAYSSDGYRFHDVFHFAFAAVLSWSPVTRKLLGCKRKSDPLVDEVEDGGRARAIEEGIAALVFDYAQRHNFLVGIEELDDNLLKTIKNMATHLEISDCSMVDWEKAIFQAIMVWREVQKNKGGTLIVNLDAKLIQYRQ